MINPSKFVKIIRQKIIPQQKHYLPVEIIQEEKELAEKVEEKNIIIKKTTSKGETKYIGIDNTDMEQRVQHTIRNLMELDADELAFIEDMNCKNMFIVVVLLNKVVATLVENMMAMD